MTHDLYKNRCTNLLKNGYSYEELNNFNNFADILSKEEFDNEQRLKQNRKNKRNRIKKALIELLRFYQLILDEKELVFGTCTLNENSLKIKEETLNKKLNKWIKNHFRWAILNVDYGKKNERKHFHFIGITTEKIENKNKKSKTGYDIYELLQKDYDLGFEPDLLKIDFNKNDINKTINYLLKLNNHTTKDSTTNRVRILKQDLVKFLTKIKKKI